MAEHSTVNRRVTGSSPVGGAHKARILRAPPWGFLLYLLPWLEPVTTPPYAGAGAPAPGPRAYTLGGITVFTSSRARKNRHPAVSSPVGTFSPSREPATPRACAPRRGKDTSPCKNVPCKNVKSNAQRSSLPTHATRPLGA